MKNLFAFLVCSTFVLIMVGCDGCEKKLLGTTKYPKVERVFMHQTNDYSFMILKEGKLESIHHYCVDKFDIFPDVEPGAPMWAEVDDWSCAGGGNTHRIIRIHVHSAKDVEGAGWNHGKRGSGQTNAVE